MALKAFRNNRQLQQFVLADVIPTGRSLGAGTFGFVEEVKYGQLLCVGKKFHEALLDVGNEGVVQKYLQGCQLMSSLRHPNITQFLGICFLPEMRLPLLVMERLETSLDDLLEHMPNLPLSLKRSVLEDVASGLLYLHKREPQIIHRDLTSNNVLLTSSLVAKITDMGNAIIIDLRPDQITKTLSKFPDTLVYMPPEALDDRHHCGTSLDIFSFGHLALYTLTQVFPGNLLPSTYYDPDNMAAIRARTELERRETYIKLLEAHPDVALVQLVKQCLHNTPEHRPSTEELLTRLQGMRGQVEGEPIKLDLVRVRLAKEVKEKDRQIKEMQEAHEAELQVLKREAQMKDDQIQQQRNALMAKENQIHQLEDALVAKNDKLQDQQAAEIEASFPLPLPLTWRHAPDLCRMICGYFIQSVVIQRKVYIAGRDPCDGAFRIQEYDISSEKWDELPQYKSNFFAMAGIRNQLVCVGGCDKDLKRSDDLVSVWSEDDKAWTYPYPNLPTTRYFCSAIAYNQWLVVAGGIGLMGSSLSSIDILDTDSKQWHTGLLQPQPWDSMKATVVGDIGYFMGDNTTDVHSVSLPALISQISSAERDWSMWKKIRGLQLTHSTPLSMGGFLLAVGGRGRGFSAVTAIHLYQPKTGEWAKVGDLPSPRYDCTCAMIGEREILVAGGRDRNDWSTNTVDIALVNAQ